ncbi:MAG: CheR family methyltransferase [Actinomycetes bacterium]
MPAPDPPDDEFEALLSYLRDTRGADFTGYKRPSLTRLVRRRMRTAGVETYRGYIDLLQVESGELAALLDVLLINVTGAFRDPVAWDVLRDELLPDVLARLAPDEPVRVWSAACATGQEAYSLAVLLHELLGHEEYLRRVKVYATDIDEGALAVARAGRYTSKELAGFADEQVAAYFGPDGDKLRFRADLRPTLIFGRHDLLQDAPISRVVLLACRNVLMYFNAETQARVLERFSFALHPHGLLLLGKAEMLLTQSQLFTPVRLSQRIFASRRSGARAQLTALAVGGQSGGSDVRRTIELAFVASPAAQVVLDSDGVVQVVNERAERDLGLRPADIGRRFAELELSRRPLELRGAVAAVQASGDPVELEDVEAGSLTGSQRWWDVRVAPLRDEAGVLGVHVIFEDVTERHVLNHQLEVLNAELSSAYEEVQSTNEELETTNEELQSAVEELETTNEELQSTNEELETMNEELQSTNEELQTLNDELRDRTVEVDYVNGFLHGILSGLDVGVVVVDTDHRVKLWNAAMEQLTGLRGYEAEDRRLVELPLGLPEELLRRCLGVVLADGERPDPVDVAVTDRFGGSRTRRLRVSPLRRTGGGVQGAVVTLDDAHDRAG